MSKLLYRIEHKESNKGPYNHEMPSKGNFWGLNLARRIENKHWLGLYDDDKCPAPRDDIARFKRSDRPSYCEVRFGFSSLQLLVNWFSNRKEVINIFKRHSFQLVSYEVTGEMMNGKKQSCAHTQHLSNRQVIPWKTLEGYTRED